MAKDDWIVTAPKGGRRRGGRRWDAGETTVPGSEQSEKLWAAIEGDPDMGIRVGEGASGSGSSSDDGPRTPEQSEVEDAIRTLKAADFTTGKNPAPKIDAIEAAIEGEVKVAAKLRNEAWAALVNDGFGVPAS